MLLMVLRRHFRFRAYLTGLGPSSLCLLATLMGLACSDRENNSSQSDPNRARQLGPSRDSAQELGAASALPPLPERVVARVNGVEIPRRALDELLDAKRRKYTRFGQEMPMSGERGHRRQLMERLIVHTIFAQATEKAGLEIDAERLQEKLENAKRKVQMPWNSYLMNLGESEQSYLELLREELREEALAVGQGPVELSSQTIDRELEAFLKFTAQDPQQTRRRVAHILIAFEPGGGGSAKTTEREHSSLAGESAMALAQEVQGRASKAGSSFAELARQYSTSPSAFTGGQMGVFTAEQLPTELAKVVFALPVGEVSSPIKTDFGIHIIKVLAEYEKGDLNSAFRPEIVDKLRDKAIKERGRKLRMKLRGEAKVEDYVNSLPPSSR